MASLRSPSPSMHAMNLRPSSLVKSLAILGTLLFIISYSYWSHLASLPANLIHRKPLPSQDFQFDSPTGQNWTYRIWQTSKEPVTVIGDEDRDHVRTWSDLNPEYRHEVLTDEMMESYVKEHFHASHPDIETLYFEVKDYILRSDLIRYLILLADGGVYNDLDVGCAQPISSWVPRQFKDSAGILLGVEVDNKFGPDGRTFTGGEDLFQLVNWTIMSKPNQPFMWFLVQRVMSNIRNLAASQNQPISRMTYSIQDVLEVTGPAALTRAFFDYASDITDSNVTYHNFTKITKPRLIGEVVILPIQAFGAGHQVKWAGWEEDGTELIHHYFAGSWKSDHEDKPPSVDEEQKKKEQDAKKTEEEKKEEQTDTETQEEHQAEVDKSQQNTEKEQEKVDEASKENQENETSDVADVESENGDSTDAKNSAKEPDPSSLASEGSPATASKDVEGGEAQATEQDEKPANNKPASVQYIENQDGKSTTNGEESENNESMKEKIDKVKAEKEAKAKEDEEREKKKAAAEAKAKAMKEEAAEKKEAEEKAEAEKTKEQKEEEERKKKWEEVIAAAPKTAPPKSEEEKKQTSNNLADYDYQPD